MKYSRKNFIGNLLLLISLNLLIKPFWIFGIDRTVQNLVDTDVYGIYYTLFNLSFILNMLLDMGTTSFNNRGIARDKNFLQRNFARTLTLRLLLGGIYMVVVMAAALVIGYRMNEFRLLIPLAINQFLSLFILYLRSNVSGMLMFKTDSFLSVADRLIMIVCCSLLIWGNITDRPFQISWFIYIQMFSYILTALIALAVVLKHCRLQRLEWDFPFFKKVLYKSLPFALVALLTNIHNRVDAVLLDRMLPAGTGASQAGIYASAYRLLDAAIIIAYLFSVILMPLFAHLISQKENFRNILKTSFVLLFVYGLLLAAFSYFYSYEIMELLYNKHVAESASVYRLLMLSILPVALTYIFGSLLTANGNLKYLNLIALGAVVINLGGNLLLIPRFQAVGSAAVSLVTQCFIICCEILLSLKLFRLKVSPAFVCKIVFFTLSVILITACSRRIPANWGLTSGLALLLSLLLVFVFRLVRLQDVLVLFRKGEE